MIEGQTKNWKEAIEIYAEISEFPVSTAMAQLEQIEDISEEVKQVVTTLINLGSEATAYVQDNFTPDNLIIENNLSAYQPGTQLDEYELLEKLGHGGMSVVFKARRLNSELQKPVAIKIFNPKVNSTELLDSFINEQEILSKFSHPNIVDMLHGGRTADDTAYLVMELIDNAYPINQYCEKHRLSTRQKIKYMADCAHALAYSHANLIIHRDLKPDNILINAEKQLKIVDFGIAKLINNDLMGHKSTLMMLTPRYAAPEQINSQPITVRTDIFSLGIVALTLFLKDDEKPLPADRLIKSCVNDQQHLDQVIKNLNVDKDLKNILSQATNIDSQKRYLNMYLFADDLDNWLDNKPVKATAPSLLYRLQKFAQRRRALFATLTTLFLTVTLGLLVLMWQYQKTKVAETKATEVKKIMLDAYTQTHPDYAQGVTVTAEDILNQTANKLADSDLDSDVKFELLQTIGIAFGQIGEPEKAADFLLQSLALNSNDSKSLSYRLQFLSEAGNNSELSEQLESIDIRDIESEADKARIYRVLAQVDASEGKFDSAMNQLNQAIELNIHLKDSQQELLLIKSQAELYKLQSKTEQGIELLEQTLQRSDIDHDSSIVMRLKSELNEMYADMGAHEKAITQLGKLIAQQRKILGDDHPELARSMTLLAGIYRIQGDFIKAKQAMQEAYEINLKVFGGNNIMTARSLNSLAMISYRSGDDPLKALDMMSEAVKIYDLTQSPDFTETLQLKTNLAAMLVLNKKPDEALKLSEEVYDIQLNKLGPTHHATLFSQLTYANVLNKLQRFEQAQALAEQAHENAIEHLGYKSPVTLGTHMLLAKTHENQGHIVKALDLYQQVLAHDLLPENNPKYPEMLQTMAGLYNQNNDHQLAEEFYKKSLNAHTGIFGAHDEKTRQAQQAYAEFMRLKKQ